MALSLMTRQDVPPLLTLSGAVLEAQWDRVGHLILSDRCKSPVRREEKKKPPCLIFGTRTIAVLVCFVVIDFLCSGAEATISLQQAC